METWMYIAIAGGVLFLLVVFLIAKRLKKRKKAKPMVKAVKKEEKSAEKEETFKDDGIIYDEHAGVDLSKIKGSQEKNENVNSYIQEDYNYDDDLDAMEEQRYREFMERHLHNKKSSKKDVDDFEKFRNEYCYSKMLTDKQLTTEIIAGLPEDIRSVVFNETFKKINLDDIDIKL